jgi:hypothetical protein
MTHSTFYRRFWGYDAELNCLDSLLRYLNLARKVQMGRATEEQGRKRSLWTGISDRRA